MAGRIPQSFIDELLNRIDVVDVIDARVPLKKAGSNYKACCPFHTEKSPSFTVSQPKQFYHCFGCGAHGTAISFLMEYEHLSFVDAIEDLAQQAGLEVEREQGSNVPSAPREDNLYEVMLRAHDFYKQQLRSHSQSAKAIEYLKNRGMNGEIAAEFGVGYAPPGWDSLIQKLGKDSKSLEQLHRAGLVIEKDNNQGYYDRFRERIMIPITDRRGRVIAFGGRILDGEESHGPKYLNSPETPIFHKGRELYGLYECRKAIRNPEKILVVEGYMDVLALAQFGIRYAVATLGTATTKEHLETLFRVVPRIIFCFDGDRAGRDAAWRALENALPNMHEGREAGFLFLPDGEDPDSMVRSEGQTAFETRIDQAMPLSKFLLEHFSEQVDLNIPDGRARLVKLVKPFLQKIPDKVFRHMMFNQLASLVSMRVQELENLIETAGQPQTKIRKPKQPEKGAQTPIRKAINLILHNPQNTAGISNFQFLQQADIHGAGLLHELLEILAKEPHLNTAALLERWRDKPEGVHLLKLAKNQLPGDDESQAGELNDIIIYLGKQLKAQRWEILQEKLATAGLSESELIEWNQLLTDNSSQNVN